MSYPTLLARPPYLVDFHGSIKVRIRFDNRDMTVQQACGPIELPDDYPVAPLVTVEAVNGAGDCIFPIQVFDYEGDRGRGGWSTYEESLFPIPKSSVEPEEVPEVEPAEAVVEEDTPRPSVPNTLLDLLDVAPEVEREVGDID